MAVALAQLDAAARQRVLIAAAGVDEHGRGAGMICFQLQLRKARIVAAPGEEIERRRMAGIAEQDRVEPAVRPGDGHHGNGMIDRAG